VDNQGGRQIEWEAINGVIKWTIKGVVRSSRSLTMGLRSGVNDSGPQKSFFAPTWREAGTRAIAFSRNGAMRSQSGSISPKEKSLGMPST